MLERNVIEGGEKYIFTYDLFSILKCLDSVFMYIYSELNETNSKVLDNRRNQNDEQIIDLKFVEQ